MTVGVFETLFKKPKITKQINGYFTMLDGYVPVFSSFEGGIYEMELTRSCIHAFASHCSKLEPNVQGADLKGLKKILGNRPNPFMTTGQFLYRTATILEVKNTVYILPILDELDRLKGYYPIDPAQTEVLDVGGEPWLRFRFRNGKVGAIEWGRVGMLTKFQMANDFRGEDNAALRYTLDLINAQNQGIKEGIKNGASYRFMATLGNFSKAADLAKERKNFNEQNFAGENGGGLLLFPNTYSNIQQLSNNSKIVDTEQMNAIQERVYDYFGSNTDILQNKAVGDSWSAYYEGKVEPFALQLSQVMTAMTYTMDELSRNNAIIWSANRLQYMTNADKLNVSSQMFDRGLMTRNMIMDIWNLPHTEDGDKYYIRKEYTEIEKLGDSPQIIVETPAETTSTEGEDGNADQSGQTVPGNVDQDEPAGGTD